MERTVILDTDVLIDLEKRRPDALAWLLSLSALPAVCGFSAMELKSGARDLAELRKIETFLQPFPIIWATPQDMDIALHNYFRYVLSHGTGLLDILIASTAIGCNEPLATFNKKHFGAIPNLQTVQPYQR